MKYVMREKRVRSYFKYFPSRYRCCLCVITCICSVITLVLILQESNSSIRISFGIERSNLNSRKPTYSGFVENVINTHRNSVLGAEEVEHPFHSSLLRYLYTNLSQSSAVSTAQIRYINSSNSGLLSEKRCDTTLFTDEHINVTEVNETIDYEDDFNTSNSFEHRLVHFDLKGAPPKLEYFEKILPMLKNNGATGILLEYEDMFPFQGMLASIASPNAYCISEIQRLVKLAETLKLEVIPLVQTFGHMEFILKEKAFQDLRETNTSASAICPSKSESFNLITEIIDQVMNLHPQAKWLHIGCDEVFYLAICNLCNKYKYNKDKLFLSHVSRIAMYVRVKYNVVPIIWDDMIRRTSSRVLQSMNFGDLVEPMVWVYAEDVPSYFFPSMWRRYRMIFKNVWAASAFKGAFGRSILVPNAKRHLRNHVSWLKVKKSPALKVMNFRGLVLTGWQRYEHFGPLCELLPVGLPSLILNLLTVSYGAYSQSVLLQFWKTMRCSDEMQEPIYLLKDPFLKHAVGSCDYPGSSIFNLVQNIRVLHKKLNVVIDTLCNCTRENSKIYEIKCANHYVRQFANYSRAMDGLKRSLSLALSTVFDDFTVSEWIQQNLNPLLNTAKTFATTSQNESFLAMLCSNNCKRTKQMRVFPWVGKNESNLGRCLLLNSYKM